MNRPHERSQARALALQLLYQTDVLKQAPTAGERTQLFDSQEVSSRSIRQRATALVESVGERRPEIDRLLSLHAKNWRLERMAVVDRNVLRLGVCELLLDEVPPKVAIDEALELAKAYSGQDSPAFVNGILDRIWQGLREERAT